MTIPKRKLMIAVLKKYLSITSCTFVSMRLFMEPVSIFRAMNRRTRETSTQSHEAFTREKQLSTMGSVIYFTGLRKVQPPLPDDFSARNRETFSR